MRKKLSQYDTDILFGKSKEWLLNFCLNNYLIGTEKWPAEHPIWDCNVAGKLSPREAWLSTKCLSKAIDNLFWITNKSIMTNKYPDFVERIKNAFETDDYPNILKEVQLRFTVAKIAPKVTALMPSTLLRVIEESKINISSGAYCPMAGFGGIIEGVKRWFNNRKLDYSNKIESYDINPNLCEWYGWEQRDVLAQTVYTDKIVIACPPFGRNTERWLGTPDEMYYDFHDWCKLIKNHIIAPNYILIGPELQSDIKRSNLFRKKVGVQYYSEYSN